MWRSCTAAPSASQAPTGGAVNRAFGAAMRTPWRSTPSDESGSGSRPERVAAVRRVGDGLPSCRLGGRDAPRPRCPAAPSPLPGGRRACGPGAEALLRCCRQVPARFAGFAARDRHAEQTPQNVTSAIVDHKALDVVGIKTGREAATQSPLMIVLHVRQTAWWWLSPTRTSNRVGPPAGSIRRTMPASQKVASVSTAVDYARHGSTASSRSDHGDTFWRFRLQPSPERTVFERAREALLCVIGCSSCRVRL
jgi:hypothetical protein